MKSSTGFRAFAGARYLQTTRTMPTTMWQRRVTGLAVGLALLLELGSQAQAAMHRFWLASQHDWGARRGFAPHAFGPDLTSTDSAVILPACPGIPWWAGTVRPFADTGPSGAHVGPAPAAGRRCRARASSSATLLRPRCRCRPLPSRAIARASRRASRPVGHHIRTAVP